MWTDPGSSPGGAPPLPNKGPAGGEPSDPNALKPPTSNFSLPDLPGSVAEYRRMSQNVRSVQNIHSAVLNSTIFAVRYTSLHVFISYVSPLTVVRYLFVLGHSLRSSFVL